jgi:NTP pyrophosphatase (non-canonical NTP hydrolase)
MSDLNALDRYQNDALRTVGGVKGAEKLLMGALGISGEGGEVADHIKKHRFQGHALDAEHLAYELGDVLWYIAVMADEIDMPLSTIAEMNVSKLRSRYPEGFDSARSINREEATRE